MVLYPSISRRFFLLVLLVFAGLLPVNPGTALADGPPKLEKSKGEACIRPAEWMRRNHMDFLKHRRVVTVREGVRVRSESFTKCADCHTSREGFCDRCHAYAAVAPNCFECHAYPK